MKTIEITKLMGGKYLKLISIALVVSCNQISLHKKGKITQIVKNKDYTFEMHFINEGQFGYSSNLIIIDFKKNQLIEEIALRSDLDNMPYIDSIKGNIVYMSYNFRVENADLKFKDVVLGDKLINNKNLIFTYKFTNKSLVNPH
ncbi:hypothetical protein [Flavobacterium branchiophilum]|nr:hypothetical protein [Flavobacterium branchiophilum]